MADDNKIYSLYDRLYKYFGPQGWWPGDSPLEIIIGAVLTQNTNWANVEKAISNLKKHSLIDIDKLYSLDIDELAFLIRPAGYYNVKARRLKNLISYIKENYNGDLDYMFSFDLSELRRNLLSVNGLGPETVDSILLYAGLKPIFVVDAYTKRIFSRHGLCFDDISYEELQTLIQDALPQDVVLYNEFHALIVRLGKDFCKKNKPLCTNCPINGL